MKAITFASLILALAVLTGCIRSGHEAGSTPVMTPSTFDTRVDSLRSIDMYCWCFVDQNLRDIIQMRELGCLTGTSVPFRSLVCKRDYKMSVTDQVKLRTISKLFHATDSVITHYNPAADTRLCLVFHYKSLLPSDTLIYFSSNVVQVNTDHLVYLKDSNACRMMRLIADSAHVSCID